MNMIDSKMADALNDQINAELYSSYLYLAMAADLSSRNFNGFAQWMRVQAQEELIHAMKLYDYLIQRGGAVRLAQVDAPATSWDSVLSAFEDAYEHEKYVTGRINSLVDLAEELRDHATRSFLQWFVDEQVEEEATADEVVGKLRMVSDSGNGMLMMDRDLGARAPLLVASDDED
jgi:ferritin